mmetsp:Transcript_17951/g.20738  ORF Transcript_17951/g.20738 Transcript_17951/m.20738 type:complete len:619 (-) Transcript_17951:145-2001(-)
MRIPRDKHKWIGAAAAAKANIVVPRLFGVLVVAVVFGLAFGFLETRQVFNDFSGNASIAMDDKPEKVAASHPSPPDATINTLIAIDDKPESVAASLPPPAVATRKNLSQFEFWDYDKAAPVEHYAKTHFLSSIPAEHRLDLKLVANTNGSQTNGNNRFNVQQALDTYASDPKNIWPSKLHLFEINPSIAKLPQSYRRDPEWTRAFPRVPMYIASYRVTDLHTCLDGAIKHGGDWHAWKKTMKKTEHLGLALLDENLNILTDITLTMRKGKGWGLFGPNFQDYRIFKLRGGKDNEEELYLSVYHFMVPLRLSVGSPEPPDGFLELPPAFPKHNPPEPTFRAFARSYVSCSLRWQGKNLLYFDEPNEGEGQPSTTTRVVEWPKGNPNRVLPVDLETKCNTSNIPFQAPYEEALKNSKIPFPRPSFRSVHHRKYQDDKIFKPDRGNACCTRVARKKIPLEPALAALYPEASYDELLVGLVHPRTRDKPNTRPGVKPRTYFSRFIAFLPKEPYTIVARSGTFCLGTPRGDEMGGDLATTNNPHHLKHWKQGPQQLWIMNETFPNCSEFHFPMAMLDKTNGTESNRDELDDSVIISYSVADCYSRFIEVKKSEIVDLFGSVES